MNVGRLSAQMDDDVTAPVRLAAERRQRPRAQRRDVEFMNVPTIWAMTEAAFPVVF